MAKVHYILLLASVTLLAVNAYHRPDLPPGPYCGRNNRCCKSRNDDCSHPILTTTCYCDEGCKNNPQYPGHDDCCPDYEDVCENGAPQQLVQQCQRGETQTQGCLNCICNNEFKWDCTEDANDPCVFSKDVVKNVNQGDFTWKAAKYRDLNGKKLKDALIYKLGTLPISPKALEKTISYNKNIEYPINFEARSKWEGLISPVFDQGWCGSDWALVIAGIASDRFNIREGASNVVDLLSPMPLLNCDSVQKRCEGGDVYEGWKFASSFGMIPLSCFRYNPSRTSCNLEPTGNLFDDGCKAPVSHHDRYAVEYQGRLTTEEDIKYDIMHYGPVHATMTVYQDFFHYKEGIYRSTPHGNDKLNGLHSVKIVGWGETESGDKFWTAANTWGKKWGENGYFRIARGVNMAGIESFVCTGVAVA